MSARTKAMPVAKAFGAAALVSGVQCILVLSLSRFDTGELFVGPAHRDVADNRPLHWALLILLVVGAGAYMAAEARWSRAAKALGVVLTVAFGVVSIWSWGFFLPAAIAWAIAVLWRPASSTDVKTHRLRESLVPIYVSSNPAELPVVKSLLSDAGIQFMVRGEQVQGMFGAGQLGGPNLIASPEICVFPADVAAARELLRTNVAGPPDGPAA